MKKSRNQHKKALSVESRSGSRHRKAKKKSEDSFEMVCKK